MSGQLFSSSKNITQASILIFIITVVSKVIAYLESAIVAAYFGTAVEIDMFYLANNISVKFSFTFFAGLSIVGVTMYNDALNSGGRDKANRFVSSLLKVVIPSALILTILLYLLAPYISAFMTRHYSEKEAIILCIYIRVLSLVSVFYVITVILSAVLNSNKKFAPGALISLVQNITIILFVVFLASEIRVWAVLLGVLFGYVAQGIFLYFCVRNVFKVERSNIRDDLELKRLLCLLVPLILGDATGEINMLVDQFISTGLGEGYVSALSYSGSLDGFVSSFFIQTISSVLLPFFSILAIEKKYDEMSSQMRRVINTMVLVLLPVTIVTVFASADIVSVAYQRGNFDSNSVMMTSSALVGYGLGFIFKAIFVTIRRPFYAIGNTKVPMYLSIFSVIVNITLTIILSRYFGIFGVTFATTIAFALGDVLAIFIMNHMIPGANWKDEHVFLGKVFVAGIVSTVLVMIVLKTIETSAIITFLTATTVCFVTYGFILKVLRISELEYLISVVVNKKKKTKD